MDKKTDAYTHIFAGLENDLFMCLPWSRENIHKFPAMYNISKWKVVSSMYIPALTS